jgi:hypothetical protein
MAQGLLNLLIGTNQRSKSMKISNQFQSIRQSETESKVEKYKGPDSLKQDSGFEIPQEILDTFENAQQNGNGGFNDITDAILDKFYNSRGSQVPSSASKYNGPDSLQVAKPTSQVEKYKGPKSLPSNDSQQEIPEFDIPDEIVEQFNKARNNPPDLFARLNRILEDNQQESSEPRIASKANQYKGPKYIRG